MNMNKLKDFTKKYGFYLAVGVISIGAITAVFVTSNQTTDVVSETEANGAEVSGEDVVVDDLDLGSDDLDDQASITEEDIITDETEGIAGETDPQVGTDQVEISTDVVTIEEDITVDVDSDALVSETFDSTTVDTVKTPFFAEGDTLAWPVQGDVIVPYTDNTTKHWTSTALNQTMRTYGICIAAEEGTSIKAPASAKVVDIVEDATSLDYFKLVGDVGQVIILDHGNGYQTQLGLQGGKADKDLLGQTVEAGATIATVGNATGPFVNLDSNVYLQVRHNNEVVNPSELLAYQADVAEGLDMGHSQE